MCTPGRCCHSSFFSKQHRPGEYHPQPKPGTPMSQHTTNTSRSYRPVGPADIELASPTSAIQEADDPDTAVARPSEVASDGYDRVRSASVSGPAALQPRATPAGDPNGAPYSCNHEVRYFFGKGIPLGVSSVLKWGVPPLANMAFAGHTENSADVQTALGYARVTYNIGVIMVMLGAFKYFQTVIPGCIGAGRKDRIPTYLRRSMLLCVCV